MAAGSRGSFIDVREHYAARFLVFGSWFQEIFPNAAYSAATDFLVLNEDPRNVGLRLRDMRAAGDPDAEVAITLLPLVYGNADGGNSDLLLFDGAGNSNTTSTRTGIAFTDTGDGVDTVSTGALQGLHYTGLGNDTFTFTNGGTHTIINDGGNDKSFARVPIPRVGSSADACRTSAGAGFGGILRMDKAVAVSGSTVIL